MSKAKRKAATKRATKPTPAPEPPAPPETRPGGWTKGKRRNEDLGDWQRVRIELVALIDEHYLVGVRSARALADAMGVSDRSVRRWMKGEDRPAPETQEMIRIWVAEQRDDVKPRRR